MSKRFEKNDRLIFHAYVVIDVMASLILLCGIILGVLTIIDGTILGPWIIFLGVMIIIPVSPAAAFFFWILNRVVLNMYCDIKLIRNKLYNDDNSYLKNLVGDEASATDESVKIPNDSVSNGSDITL